jgi:hypothetical protein
MDGRFDAGKILSDTAALLGAHPRPALIALLLLVVPSAAIDTQASADAAGFNVLVSIMNIVAQYQVTQAVLRGENLLAADRPAGRAGSFFGVALLSGLAIGFGMLLLILPGLYLYARWAIAVPAVIGEGQMTTEALATSMERTRGHVVPIMIAFAVLNLPSVAAIALMFTAYPEGVGSLPVALFANTLFFGAFVACWYCAVAVYRLTGAPEQRLEDVFA